VRILLVHNPSAGGGQESDELVALLTDLGHDVRYASSKTDWEKLMQDSDDDFVVVAGGDGTVGKVARAAASHGLPFAPLPIGTANNIGKSLGIVGDARTVVESWSGPDARRPFDFGVVSGQAGRDRFVEAFGGGPFAELIGRGEQIEADARLLGRETDRALHLLIEILGEATPRRWEIASDGEDLGGEYPAVEILNGCFVGPNVPLAIDADSTDGRLEIVRIADSDRAALIDYLDRRLRQASAALPSLTTVQVESLEIVAPPGIPLHLDDRPWPDADSGDEPLALTVSCEHAAATVVIGRDRDSSR
jgi:diacylglycerol kinase (ATP)